mmetsp:Transcript_27935/g.93407  ORF Transcript_27935/g.93407 Transcript_27935/m.93407 type:complete len:212 (+) Transcript_27935:135-770(+)
MMHGVELCGLGASAARFLPVRWAEWPAISCVGTRWRALTYPPTPHTMLFIFTQLSMHAVSPSAHLGSVSRHPAPHRSPGRYLAGCDASHCIHADVAGTSPYSQNWGPQPGDQLKDTRSPYFLSSSATSPLAAGLLEMLSMVSVLFTARPSARARPPASPTLLPVRLSCSRRHRGSLSARPRACPTTSGTSLRARSSVRSWPLATTSSRMAA